MQKWTLVCQQNELLPGEYRVVDADGTRIAVINFDGQYYAIEDICTHDGGELSGGSLEKNELICPRHGARFDVRTGEALCAPAYEPTATFPIRIDALAIYTRDDRWD